MRTSILTRSVISIASLAIGSVALVAAPAVASAPSGVTRDLVLAALHGARDGVEGNPPARVLADAVCKPLAGEVRGTTLFRTVDDPGEVDGILVQADYTDSTSESFRLCSFAAFVPTSPYDGLSGTATIGDDLARGESVSSQATLSGDVSIVGPVEGVSRLSVNAEGAVIRTTTSTTDTSRTITPKTTQQKKAAKKTRDRTVSAAKKAYAKAMRKAGSSSAKKAAAKRAYVAKKKAANATYRAARAGTLTIGTTTTATTTSSPFSVPIYGGCLSSVARC